ncbi:MAG: hypothetical protein M3N47_11955 [Chloroflexota bacterium]|nr:hypothetical protein [Chloroflexota bacterium]
MRAEVGGLEAQALIADDRQVEAQISQLVAGGRSPSAPTGHTRDSRGRGAGH